MGILISFPGVEKPAPCSPLRNRAQPTSVQGFCGASPCSQVAPVRTKGMLEEQILRMIEESSKARGLPCLAPEANCEQDRSARFSGLAELVLFSPEIQWEAFRTRPPGTYALPKERHWGDVFVKTKDLYPFAFTVYTHSYVVERQRFFGESIVPSPEDIVLHRKSLAPMDILRAALKWVNLYYPSLLGKPVSLEKQEILDGLTCDPGAEVLVTDLA